jgi:hypothetical protein
VSETVCAVASGLGRDEHGNPFRVQAGRTRIDFETFLRIQDAGTVELFGFDSGTCTAAPSWQLPPAPRVHSRSCERVSLRSRSEHPVTVSLRHSWDALRAFAGASRDGREAGGFLFGPHVRSWHSRIVITSATEAAKEREPNTMKLDLEKHVLRDMASIRASGVDDFGECGFWHTHPNTRVAAPSEADLAAWLSSSDWLGRPYIGLILTADSTDERWIHPHVGAWITRRLHGRAICEPVDVEL